MPFDSFQKLNSPFMKEEGEPEHFQGMSHRFRRGLNVSPQNVLDKDNIVGISICASKVANLNVCISLLEKQSHYLKVTFDGLIFT
jgi:hypothetical protein